MTQLDHPLKMLISTLSEAFAEWLLGGPVKHVRPLNLIGQTRMREPEREVSEAVTRIQQVADEEQRARLLSVLASLISSEEAMKVSNYSAGSRETGFFMREPGLQKPGFFTPA